MLTIRLLGRPRISSDGQLIDLARRKSRALVYFLAAHDRPLTRDELIGVLWPDLERAAAQQTLRVTLHGLRQALGEALVVERDTLALAAVTDVDVRRFEKYLSPPTEDQEMLTTTLDLHRGDFLDGFDLPDAPEFDDWRIAQTEHYRRLAIRGLVALAELQEKRGRLADAVQSLDRALAMDPLQEDLQRTRMRLVYLGGDRASAIRLYENLRKLLRDELGVPPMAATRAMYDAIINDTLLTSSTESGSGQSTRGNQGELCTPTPDDDLLPFAGRQAQLLALDRWANGSDTATKKFRGLALIEGEPGIGKTRLVGEFIRRHFYGSGRDGGISPAITPSRLSGRALARFQSEGESSTGAAIVLVGVAHELERSLPYQPIIEALRGLLSRPDWPTIDAELRNTLSPIWRAELGRLIPELAVPLPAGQRTTRVADESRLWESISRFLLALARQRPSILFIDDLHWAEDSTLGVLGYLVRQTIGTQTFFLGATRPFAPRSALAKLLQTLTREGRVLRLGLPRLESEDITTIANRLSPAYAFPLADWLLRTSEGNAYVLAEMVRYAREHQLLLPNGVLNLDGISTATHVPGTVYSLVQSRLQQLSDTARRVLDAAVAIGREFEFDLVARVAGLSENGALDALDELIASGLVLQMDGTRYRFDHSLTIEVAYREVNEARHRLLHRHVAEALEAMHHGRREEVAGLLAWHFSEGGAPERAAPYALLAGQQALRMAAWSEAAAFFEQALAGMDSTQRWPALMGLGEARQSAGHAIQASEAFREALALALSKGDASGIDEARLALTFSFLQQSRYAEAMGLARQVIAEGLAANAVRAQFLWGTALSLEGADLVEAANHLRTAEELCAQTTPPDLLKLAQIKFELGSIKAQEGDLISAISLYNETLEICGRSTDQEAVIAQVVLAHNNLAYHMHLLNDSAAADHVQTGLDLAKEKGLLGLQPYLLSTMGEIELGLSNLEAAERHFTEGLAIAEQLAIPERIAGLTANLGLVAQARGQLTLAIHRLSSAMVRADAVGARHLSAQIRLWLVPLLPPDEAHAYLMEAKSIAESSGRRRLAEEVQRLETQIREADAPPNPLQSRG